MDGNKKGSRQDVRKKFDGERDRNEEGSGIKVRREVEREVASIVRGEWKRMKKKTRLSDTKYKILNHTWMNP
jgi:hypothetical protein